MPVSRMRSRPRPRDDCLAILGIDHRLKGVAIVPEGEIESPPQIHNKNMGRVRRNYGHIVVEVFGDRYFHHSPPKDQVQQNPARRTSYLEMPPCRVYRNEWLNTRAALIERYEGQTCAASTWPAT